ncbi:MotA/TolQ/ExbB proton channel family protein [Pontiella sulfatireligans]|uniref:Biopolymer transport protein ExbB n=1 Tax=Pontiella sulfatireligans TaxID=2750658 RepID=A0A6C2UN87_9BACT|nr:MotA/TolQ/ExbB proton channel family protein [Pontiella sulfatireligans]VGO21403.1 Biopolymer transport protein ExbB [Pontiella sulfatireligans]
MEETSNIWTQALEIWSSGGWAMIALAIDALIIFYLGSNIFFRIRAKGYLYVSEKKMKKWVKEPAKGRGPVGKMIRFVMAANNLKEINILFDELQKTEIAPLNRDLKVMQTCVSIAPLLGLLGTVTGMLATFAALATGAGGDKTMGMVASGISEALITTETGLLVALPGIIFQYKLAREHAQYKAFLAHLQTVCSQRIYKDSQKQKAQAA